MGKMQLDKRQSVLLKKQLIKVNRECIKNPKINLLEEYGTESKWRNYDLRSNLGKLVFQSFTDDELLDILKDSASILNHSPSQKEVFWVIKNYIKVRFKKWPYALSKAGLSKAAGSGGKSYSDIQKEKKEKEFYLEQLRQATINMGHIPHPHQVPKITEGIKKYFTSWGSALKAAKIDTINLAGYKVYIIDNLEEEYVELLNQIRDMGNNLKRAPMHTEVDPEIRHMLIERCGSWRNVLHQLGMEPVIRRSPFESYYLDHRSGENREHHNNNLTNCYYKLFNANSDVKEAVKKLKNLEVCLGRKPEKSDLDDETRATLINACGSWANVLFQIKDSHQK